MTRVALSLVALPTVVLLAFACAETNPVPFGASGAGGLSTGGGSGTGASTSTGASSSTGGQGEAGADNLGGSTNGTGGVAQCVGAECDPTPDTCEGASSDDSANPCSSIPKFTGNQVVDGDPEDFCNVPFKRLAAATAGFVEDADGNPTTGDGKTSEALVRVAWSPSALHVHVHVKDPTIVVGIPDLWQNDNVQLFVAAAAPPDNVSIDTCPTELQASGAQQIYLLPGDSSEPSYKCGDWAPSGADYAARSSGDGYDVELRYPWPSNVSPGGTIGFDLLVGVNDKAGSNWRDYEYGLDLGEAECGGLYCDTGNWCTPTLAN